MWFRRQSQAIGPELVDGGLNWCRTTRCPKCNGPGYLDRIDLVDCTTSQHCPACRHHWETSERASTHRSA